MSLILEAVRRVHTHGRRDEGKWLSKRFLALQMQAVGTGPAAHGSLMDALGVAEFLACFGALCEAPVLSLGSLQARASLGPPCLIIPDHYHTSARFPSMGPLPWARRP